MFLKTETEEIPKRYFIGCFADMHGYACCLVSEDNGLLKVLAEKHCSTFVSFQLLKKTIDDLIKLTGNDYIEAFFYYDLPSLTDFFDSESFQSTLKNISYTHAIAFDAEFPVNEVLKLQAMIIDKSLKVSEELKKELASYDVYKRQVKKRLCAVFTVLRDFERLTGGM